MKSPINSNEYVDKSTSQREIESTINTLPLTPTRLTLLENYSIIHSIGIIEYSDAASKLVGHKKNDKTGIYEKNFI